MSNSPSKKQSTGTVASSSLSDLAAMLGGNSLLDPAQLDAGLLWMVLVVLLRRGAAIHFGMNKSSTSMILTVYDGDFPHKEYCDTIDRVHHILAALVKVYGKKPLEPEWQEIVEKYFP